MPPCPGTKGSTSTSCTCIQRFPQRECIGHRGPALHWNIPHRPSGETWRGKWQGNEIAAKILALRECTPRIARDFNEEYPKLRYICDISRQIMHFLSESSRVMFLKRIICNPLIQSMIFTISGFSPTPMCCPWLVAATPPLTLWWSASTCQWAPCTAFCIRAQGGFWTSWIFSSHNQAFNIFCDHRGFTIFHMIQSFFNYLFPQSVMFFFSEGWWWILPEPYSSPSTLPRGWPSYTAWTGSCPGFTSAANMSWYRLFCVIILIVLV